MPARVVNIAPCITQVTFKLVHYALLINQLCFFLTFLKVMANYLTDKYGLDYGLELTSSNCVLTMFAESWSLKRGGGGGGGPHGHSVDLFVLFIMALLFGGV